MKHIFYFVFVFLIITIFNFTTVFAGDYYEIKTKEAQEQTDNLTAFLKETTEKMWETGKFTEDEKRAVYIKMQDYYNYLNENGDYIVVGTAVSGGPVGARTYNGIILYDLFYSALDERDLYEAIRVFDINCFLYMNGYKYLTSYLSEYFVKENG